MVLGERFPTIFILHLRRSREDAARHLDFSSRPIMRSVNLAVLTQLHQDLAGLHRITPDIVPMANINR